MHLNHLDCHYHAGLERTPGFTLRDYVSHAERTGRRVLGVTDHWDLYWENRHKMKGRAVPYPPGIAGLRQFHAELSALKPEFPNTRIYFCPEISQLFPAIDDGTVPKEVMELSDFLLFELPFLEHTPAANTEAMVVRMGEIASHLRRYGKKGVIAHPFRYAVVNRLRSGCPGEFDGGALERSPEARTQLNRFFGFDLTALADAALYFNLPLEINAGTLRHARKWAHGQGEIETALQHAYGYFCDRGVDLIPGSDMHELPEDTGDKGQNGYFPPGYCETLKLGDDCLQFAQSLS